MIGPAAANRCPPRADACAAASPRSGRRLPPPAGSPPPIDVRRRGSIDPVATEGGTALLVTAREVREGAGEAAEEALRGGAEVLGAVQPLAGGDGDRQVPGGHDHLTRLVDDLLDVTRIARGEQIQLFAVSGYAQPEDVRRAIAVGFDGHVAKPPDLDALERLLA